MSLRITKIEIKNFRSIKSLTIKPCELAVLVGKNDSGKSNILRSLNLFFSGSADSNGGLDFETEHNVFNQPNRRAKEISIRLELELPETYHETNGNYISWEKRWRSTGLVKGHTDYTGYRKIPGKRGGRVEPVEIPYKSNLHTLLRNINFIYVPAVKDPRYFSQLRASIYNVIAEVADREFRDSSQGFENSISSQLEDLTTQIVNSLGLRSRLALPKDLSHIFESLDFLSEEKNISLDVRGDGVKARHIPLILKFMADKKQHGLSAKGAPPHTFIWAYEEPENNLELANCIELADQFWDFLDDGISQIFLTTHSPVFYNLHLKKVQESKRISRHHIFRDLGEDGTREAGELNDLDERMGTMSLFSPLITELENRVRQQEEARYAAEEMLKANRRKLFVEGCSDKLVIEKALSVFSPDHAKEIDVETTKSAGVNYVVDMLSAWRSKAKHDSELPCAAGLVDSDEEGRKKANEFNKLPKNTESAKCFKLPTPSHLVPILNGGFRIPVVLETIYNKKTWEWAAEHGYLSIRDKNNVIPSVLANQIFSGDTKLDDHLEESWKIYIEHEFNGEGKIPTARYVQNMDEKQFREDFSCLEKLVNDIVEYLFPTRN